MNILEHVRGFYLAWIDYPLQNGDVIADRYRIIQLLGIGSYGLTYRCLDLQSGQQVAIKQAKPSKGELGRELLRREMTVLAKLRHPSIPRVRDLFDDKNRLFMASEFAGGQTVEELIFERGRLFSEREALDFIGKLTEIVAYVHRQGYVHLDIRIPNVIADGNRIHLIDFGLARRIGEAAALVPPFRSGVRLAQDADPAADLSDMGHLLLFMLYSSYHPAEMADKGWEQELDLTPGARHLLRRLLHIEAPYEGIDAFIGDLERCRNPHSEI
ncbi:MULTISPECIES: protein kinase [unclassified Paenibacillus]|uniref:serine/threonine protein kinase n=1 Tax=unclassified Paenibacillus TaxID=185978 RepID=UPI0009543C83|nr:MULTISPECIES: protein kinase [unclassified Paenibacillus]ASS65390.2 protein kinase [Paenibacillus sp. RUD330]SIQ37824.1 serine/threonine protein kinase [Paenibacillus sp. RU4X]SIQ60004.1 serine/threonine protein kinase [Paenibacillus sp. RU4T]